jgi:hypothetical protein
MYNRCKEVMVGSEGVEEGEKRTENRKNIWKEKRKKKKKMKAVHREGQSIEQDCVYEYTCSCGVL